MIGKYLFLIAFYAIIKFGQNANILGIFPLPSSSHHVMFERLFKALAEKGHNVDIVGPFPLEQPFQRYTDLSLKGSIKSNVNSLKMSFLKKQTPFHFVFFILNNGGVDLCETLSTSPVLQNLKNTNKKYDLLITEVFGTDFMLGFAHLFKIPIVSLTTSVDFAWGSSRIVGNPDNPSYIPNYFVPFSSKMSLSERIWNTIIFVYSKLTYKYVSIAKSNIIAKKFFGDDLPDLEELTSNTSLILVNSHFSMNQARPAVPNFIEVGGLHITEPKQLNKHFENLVKIGEAPEYYKGIIYFSLGSLVRSDSFDPEKLQAIFDAFAELPNYKVLFKTNKESLDKNLKFPKNVHFEKWFPQIDILCHPNVKLFVSHGGLMGSQESVYCAKPRLGIPIFGDQISNIRQSEKMGCAIGVDYNNINKNSILHALKKLLENKKYTENVKKLSQLFRDRPLTALDTAIYWIEYVIRHKGAPHLRSEGADLPWYQYFLLDVALVLLSITFLIIALVISAFKLIIKQFAKTKSKKE